MNKEEKIDKIMNLVKNKSSFDDDKLVVFKEILESLRDSALNQLVAGIVFADKPFKPNKIWRLE